MDCDFSHDPADVPRLIAACEDGRRPRARLALRRRAAARRTGGSPRRIVSWGGSFYARTLLGVRDPRPDRRLQVLPPRACSRRVDLDAIDSKGYAFQIETTYRTLRKGFQRRRGADPLRRPHRGPVEDEPGDRPRGRLEGAGCFASPPWPDGSNGATLRAVDELDARRPSTTRSRAAADRRRLLGAVVHARAGRSSRSSSSSQSRVPVARLNIDEHPEIASRYEILSIPTVMLFADGEPRGTVVGAAPARALRALASGSAPSRRARRARRAASARRLSPPRSARSP